MQQIELVPCLSTAAMLQGPGISDATSLDKSIQIKPRAPLHEQQRFN